MQQRCPIFKIQLAAKHSDLIREFRTAQNYHVNTQMLSSTSTQLKNKKFANNSIIPFQELLTSINFS